MTNRPAPKAKPKAKTAPVDVLVDALKEAIVEQYERSAYRARALIACDEILRELEGGTPAA